MDVAQQVAEAGHVEFAVGACKIRVVQDRLGDLLIGEGQTHGEGAVIQNGFRNKPVQHLAVKAHGAGLIIGDGAFGLPLQGLQLGLVGGAIGVRRDFRAADLGDLARAEAAKDVADAPDHKAQADETHHQTHEDSPDPSLGGFAHAF